MKKLVLVLLVSFMALQLSAKDFDCVECKNGAWACRASSSDNNNPQPYLRKWCDTKGGVKEFSKADDSYGTPPLA